MSSLRPQPGEAFDSSFFDHGRRSYHPPAGSPNRVNVPPVGREIVEVPRSEPGAFRVPRPYVRACAKASLGLAYEGGRVVFKPLMCGSWSCPYCRRVLAARTLDRLRSGLESRSGSNLSLVTLTVDPSLFGARVIGRAIWEGGRETNLWSEPTLDQFRQAVAAMSGEFDRLMKRLNIKAKRLGYGNFGYFRVVELHRNGWPHYHVVLEHPELSASDIQKQIDGWSLGITEVKPVSVDDAVGELAPYLVCTEKASGHKAYQFAATALPKHFRLYTSSRGFLGDLEASEREAPAHSLVLRGHFSGFRSLLESFGEGLGEPTDVRWVCPPPSEVLHRPPSALQASGAGAVVLYAELVRGGAMVAPAEWFKPGAL